MAATLEPLPEEAHNDANKVRGCASQVWLQTSVERGPDGEPVLHFLGDSDAHIVRGLVALTLAFFSGRTAPGHHRAPTRRRCSAAWASSSI